MTFGTRTTNTSSGFFGGALAGAAGTTALNAATYLDMAVRARPSSDTPQQLVDKVTGKVGLAVPGDEEDRDNRLAGLGPLSGIAVGVGVGAVAAAVRRGLKLRGVSLPAPVAVIAISAAAMALSDVPLKLLGISDPKEWKPKDWAADALPHLLYGLVTYAGLRAADHN
jgi:hypothetical protein